MNHPLVSVVITTKNEEKNIENCLLSIKEQTYTEIEIIVVDNYSTDKTIELSRKYTDKVFEKGPERSAQRNFGILEMSKGKYAMFVDADMIFAPSLVEACVQSLEDHPWKALHISEIVLGTGFGSQIRRFERSFYDGTVVDGARFFMRSTFIEIDGFDESLNGPEDWDFDKKIKQLGKIGLLSPCPSKALYDSWEFKNFIDKKGGGSKPFINVIFHNESEFNLKQYLRKKKYYVGWFNAYFKKWGRDDPDIKKQVGLAYRYLWVFVEHGKWKRVLMNPLLMVGVFGLRFLVGLVFLLEKFKLPNQEMAKGNTEKLNRQI